MIYFLVQTLKILTSKNGEDWKNSGQGFVSYIGVFKDKNVITDFQYPDKILDIWGTDFKYVSSPRLIEINLDTTEIFMIFNKITKTYHDKYFISKESALKEIFDNKTDEVDRYIVYQDFIHKKLVNDFSIKRFTILEKELA